MTETPSPLLRVVAARMLDKPAADPFVSFVRGDHVARLDWGRFWALVDGYADRIRQEIGPDDFVLIMSRTCPEAVACFFAAMAAGRLVSFFPPPHRVQDKEAYRNQQSASIGKIDPDHIVTFDPQAAEMVRALGFGHKLREFPPPAPGDAGAALGAFVERLRDERRPLFVQHSSGTTGIKKAVAIPPKMLCSQFNNYWLTTVEALTPAPRIASWLPLYHDMGLIATLLLPTLGGAQMAFVDPFSWVEAPQVLLDMIQRERSNLVWMPNFAFRHYVRLKRALQPRDLSSVLAWINCSEPCRAPDVEAFEEAFAAEGVAPGSVVGCYAMAESVFAVSQGDTGRRAVLQAGPDQTAGTRVQRGQKAVLSSGRVVPGIEVAVLAGDEALPDGHYGEIAIRGEFVFDGYWHMSAADSNVRPDGFFRTGDLGAIEGGELFVFGRLKETIIINGKNIFAGDVEAAAGSVEGVKAGRVVAFGVENERTGSEDLVIVAECPDPTRPRAEIVSEVTRLIDSAFLVAPKAVVLVEDRWLVKSTSGKISRADNRSKYLRMRDAHAA